MGTLLLLFIFFVVNDVSLSIGVGRYLVVVMLMGRLLLIILSP